MPIQRLKSILRLESNAGTTAWYHLQPGRDHSPLRRIDVAPPNLTEVCSLQFTGEGNTAAVPEGYTLSIQIPRASGCRQGDLENDPGINGTAASWASVAGKLEALYVQGTLIEQDIANPVEPIVPIGEQQVRTLYSDFLQPRLHRPRITGGTHWGHLNQLTLSYTLSPLNWVHGLKPKRIAKIRQLDKYEPIITYYLFAALAEATNNFASEGAITQLLGFAFVPEIAQHAARQLALFGADTLQYEAQIAPSVTLRNAVAAEANSHPVAYVRRIAAERARVRFESATCMDCFIGDSYGTGKVVRREKGSFGFGVEAKFTSDVSGGTEYSTHRNQIARNIEVGNERFQEFVFLLIAPRCYRIKASRLFVYKMMEYKGDHGVAALRRDIILPQSDDVLNRWIERTGWLDWEHVVEFLYPDGNPRDGWNSEYAEPLQHFLKDRRIWPFETA